MRGRETAMRWLNDVVRESLDVGLVDKVVAAALSSGAIRSVAAALKQGGSFQFTRLAAWTAQNVLSREGSSEHEAAVASGIVPALVEVVARMRDGRTLVCALQALANFLFGEVDGGRRASRLLGPRFLSAHVGPKLCMLPGDPKHVAEGAVSVLRTASRLPSLRDEAHSVVCERVAGIAFVLEKADQGAECVEDGLALLSRTPLDVGAFRRLLASLSPETIVRFAQDRDAEVARFALQTVGTLFSQGEFALEDGRMVSAAFGDAGVATAVAAGLSSQDGAVLRGALLAALNLTWWRCGMDESLDDRGAVAELICIARDVRLTALGRGRQSSPALVFQRRAVRRTDREKALMVLANIAVTGNASVVRKVARGVAEPTVVALLLRRILMFDDEHMVALVMCLCVKMMQAWAAGASNGPDGDLVDIPDTVDPSRREELVAQMCERILPKMFPCSWRPQTPDEATEWLV